MGGHTVKNGRVYAVPCQPYLWIDRPPSANQIIGLVWLAKLLYPQKYHYDMEPVVKEFHQKFYHCHLSDAQMAVLLQGDGPSQM
ncbi:MAG: hypothetical protein QM786_11285 [Breznakibacter sp.]